MKNLLYIGNNLKQPNTNISAIGILGPLLNSEGYVLYYASSKANKLLRLWDMLYCVCRYARRVDLVLMDTYSTTNFYYAVLVSQLCRLLRLRYIPILHGGNLPMRLVSNPRLCRAVFKPAYTLVSPSVHIKQAFENKGYQNIEFIPNTLQIQNYTYTEREFKSIRLLWVRSFSEIYNPLLAVKVLKRLQDEGLEVSVCMVGPDTGDGSFEEVKRLAKALEVDITFTGKLTKNEWTQLATDYTIFINTTNFDNMPLSVIEAMGLGLLIVSTDVGGMPYLINNETDGLLVPPNNADAFVTAIKQVVNNPDASRVMALKARQKVEQFDWEVVKQQWFEILK